MSAGHTPGPWVHHPDDNIIGTRDGRKLLEWQARSQFVGMGERDANARLISAAPELLFELEGLVAFSDGFGLYGDGPAAQELRKWIAGARAAIAKATGEKQ